MVRVVNSGGKTEKFMYNGELVELAPGSKIESKVPGFFNWLVAKLGYTEGPDCPLKCERLKPEKPAKAVPEIAIVVEKKKGKKDK